MGGWCGWCGWVGELKGEGGKGQCCVVLCCVVYSMLYLGFFIWREKITKMSSQIRRLRILLLLSFSSKHTVCLLFV